MNILRYLNNLILIFFVFQIVNVDCKDKENEYKLKEECEQLIVYYESYKTAYNSNPNNVFIKDVLLVLIEKLEEKRKHPLIKYYIQSRIDFDKLSKLKVELRIDKYKSKILATTILVLSSMGVYRNKTSLYNYIINNTDTIFKSSLFAIIPASILSLAIYKVIYKSSKYFTDSLVSSNERIRLEQKAKQDNTENNILNMNDEKNSKAKLYMPQEIEEKFNSVAGVASAKEELEDIIDFLQNPQKYKSIGAKIPKGVLLVGEPGNGKTMLARAVAGEANCNFFSVNGSEFVEQWVGVGAARVRDLFTQARKHAPCIIFFDEIDAIGAKRTSNGESGGEREYSQTLNQLLVGMDGFEKSKTPIIVIGATNKPEILDKALTRPGRFDRVVNVTNPDLLSRQQILKIHIDKIKAENIDTKILAAGTPGFSGAQLANLVNEAAIIAVKNQQLKVTMQNFDVARDKILLGKESPTVHLTPHERKIIGYHEAGHALVALLMPEICDPIFKITISPRSKSLGVTHTFPETETHLVSKDDLIGKIKVCLGGRIAEELTFDEQYTGCSNDFEKATKIAKSMVYKYGMSASFGTVNCEIAKPYKVEDEVQKELKKYYEETYNLLSANKDKLDKLANALIDKQTLFADEIYKLLNIKPRINFKIS